MSYKDSEIICVHAFVCVSVCVHIHMGKLLSTSNQGPNQHPIAHPHNLSLYPSLFCSSYFHSLSPSHGLASAFFRPFFPPSSCSSLEMAAAAAVVMGVRWWGGGLLGMVGTVQAQLRGQLSAFPQVLVVMLEGKDKSG